MIEKDGQLCWRQAKLDDTRILTMNRTIRFLASREAAKIVHDVCCDGIASASADKQSLGTVTYFGGWNRNETTAACTVEDAENSINDWFLMKKSSTKKKWHLVISHQRNFTRFT